MPTLPIVKAIAKVIKPGLQNPRAAMSRAERKRLLAQQPAAGRPSFGQIFRQHARSIASKFPLTEVPANHVVTRYVDLPQTYVKDYKGILTLPPDSRAGEKGPKALGGYSEENRYSGLLTDGTIGLSGSYWGDANGVAAEKYHYAAWDEPLKPKPGDVPRLMAKHGYVHVQAAYEAWRFGLAESMPRRVLFAGACSSELFVARTIHRMQVLNLRLNDPEVVEFLERHTHAFEEVLDPLGFADMQSAVADPDFRDLARTLAFEAVQACRAEGILASSVRQEVEHLSGYDGISGCNLVLTGKGESVAWDRLLGCGVIQFRSGPDGLTVTAAPLFGMNAAYVDKSPKSLMVIRSENAPEAASEAATIVAPPGDPGKRST
ncbi:hypothetical protein BH11PSE8_BH11PSE8_04120 [soil metagenome]